VKKIFVIVCNAKKENRKAPYVEAYIEQAQNAGNEVRTINVYDLKIDYLDLGDRSDLEYDLSLTGELKQAQENFIWADQIVFAYPIWHLNIPAKLKSFMERIFQPGVIFRFGRLGPEPIHKGKTAVIMQSYFMPDFVMKYCLGDLPFKIIKTILSKWCGFKIVKRFDFDNIANVSEAKKQKMVEGSQNVCLKDRII